MIKLQGKTLGQSTQDNRDHMTNKLELGTTVTRSLLTKIQVFSSQETREGEEGLKAYQVL
jgi:hypothetical protein